MTSSEHDQAGSVTFLGLGLGHALRPLAGELRDRTLVNLTSGSSSEARDISQWAVQHEVAYLDGAVLADPDGNDPGLAALHDVAVLGMMWNILNALLHAAALIDESKAHGVSSDLPLQIKAVAERAVADGLGQSGYAAMISQFRRPE